MKIVAGMLLLLLPLGCASEPSGESIAQESPIHHTATDIPPEQATAAYWLAQPATASASGVDFTKLCNACMDTARDEQFIIDRTDFRAGVITTRPMVSPQFFEVWRSDYGTFSDLVQSSLQTIRRTIRFELSRSEDGVFTARPKVLVEKLSLVPRRITAEVQYIYVFSPLGNDTTFKTPQGVIVPTRYWYAIGRDEAMEKQLADQIAHKLREN
jgi:hypothetical protein